MSDLLLRVVCCDGERHRNPRLAPGTSIPLLLVLLLMVTIFFPSLFTPYTPEQMNPSAILQLPDLRHWFGTDQLGRDMFAHMVYDTSLSLSIGVGAILVADTGGVVPGILADLVPRAVRQLLVRLLDIMPAFLDLLLALLVITVLGRGSENTLQAAGLAGIAGYARLMRAQALQVRLSGYAQHAVALGESPVMIILYHIVPNTLRPPLVLATVGIGYSILSVSALSFPGLGATPPTAEWGALLSEGRNFLDSAPQVNLLPANAVTLSMTAITLLGRRVQTLIAKGEIV